MATTYTLKTGYACFQGVLALSDSVKIPVVVIEGQIVDNNNNVVTNPTYNLNLEIEDSMDSLASKLEGITTIVSIGAYNDATLKNQDPIIVTNTIPGKFYTKVYNYSGDVSSPSTGLNYYLYPDSAVWGTTSFIAGNYAFGIVDYPMIKDSVFKYNYIPYIVIYDKENNIYYTVGNTEVDTQYRVYSQSYKQSWIRIGTDDAIHGLSNNIYAITLSKIGLEYIRRTSGTSLVVDRKLTSLYSGYLSWDIAPYKKDPYSGGGSSGSGGGTGSFDGTGDAISAPSAPTLGATTTGFVSLYNPTLSQVQELASYMWSDAFSIDSFKKLFADPMDTILGLSIVPVAVPGGETTTLKVGNLSTGISITRAGAQYITVDCGSIAVNEYWGAYLDYAPYTKLEIYLPYIGTHQLSADDVMGKTISVKYNVDILSGSCVAFITCGDSVLYTFSGQCSQNIPITGEDFTSNLMGAISFAAGAGAVIASGGGAAAVMPAASGLTSSYINAFKPDIQRSGNIGGTSGMLGIQVPYLILTRPRQCLPENQNKYLGYPSFITEELSELSGYTEIEDIQLEGCTATDTEIDEIKSLLAGGVLL